MKFYEDEKYTKLKNGLIICNLLFIAVILFSYIYNYFERPINVVTGALFPFALSIIIMYCLLPFVNFFSERMKIDRKISILIALVIFTAFLAYIIMSLLPLLMNQLNGFIDYFVNNNKEIYKTLDNDLLLRNVNFPKLVDTLKNLFFENSFNILNSSIGIVTGLFSFLFMTPVFTVMLMFSYDTIKEKMKKNLVKYHKEEYLPLCSSVEESVGKYIKVTLIDCFIIGVISFFLFSFLKLDYVQLFSLIVGLGNIIPFIGPFIGLIPVLFYTGIKTPHLFWIILISIMAIQSVEANIIKPWLTSKSVNIHPITTLVVVLVSSSLFGIIGAFLGIPIYIVLKLIIQFYISKNDEIIGG